ncbi:MAG: D-tyrosyl-tRNA(Tyr) deacylase [Cyclobacteriaceae bacterium]|nr:D-tyrosyl-tRNA(Tyr) deacylase [Cyclobacteriaceae bacterium]MCH8516201.1 D-tyrosyl-tRNA(Tyr) deacylase [Cyclobacteriaceae bacterium]
MIGLIQRVSQAKVSVAGEVKGEIGQGILLLLGVGTDDEQEDVDWLTKKVVNLRIFNDEEGVMNRSLQDIDGELLIISQFTLHAATKKGNRPSYIAAARPEKAIPLYEAFITSCEQQLGKKVECGVFGADMQVALINDGPVTISIDTRNKK